MSAHVNRYAVALCALLAVTALAGCGTPGGSGTPSQSPNGTTTPNPTTETPGPYDLPLNGSAIRARHVPALEEAGSFVYSQRAVARSADSGALLQYTNVSARIDRATGRYRLLENSTTKPPTGAYVDRNGTVYLRQRSRGTIAYDRQPNAGGSTDAYRYPQIDRYLRGLEYRYEGTDRRGGETVHVYAASGTDSLDPRRHGLTALDPASVTAISAELRVTGNGAIRSFNYDVTGTGPQGSRIRYVVDVEYSDIGSTTVSEPAWLDQAKNVTGE